MEEGQEHWAKRPWQTGVVEGEFSLAETVNCGSKLALRVLPANYSVLRMEMWLRVT